MTDATYILLLDGLIVALTVLGFVVIGTGLTLLVRDWLDRHEPK